MLDVEVQPLLTPHIELVTLIARGYFPSVSLFQKQCEAQVLAPV